MAAYTTTLLLAAVARKSMAPTGQETFSATDILAIADEESVSLLVPEIIQEMEEFFLSHTDTTLVVGQYAYPINPRAVGLVVREISLIDANGHVTDLSKMEIEDISSTTATGTPAAFYFKGNDICLYPIPDSTSYSLRQYFFLSPGNLVETSEVGIISAINTTTKVVAVSSIPSSWATGNTFDFVSKSGGHEYEGIDYVSSLVSGTNITFTSTLPTTLAVGDYVSLQGTSPLVQLPAEFRTCLIQAVVAVLLESQSLPGADNAYAKLVKMLDNAKKLIKPRVIGEPAYILPPSWV